MRIAVRNAMWFRLLLVLGVILPLAIILLMPLKAVLAMWLCFWLAAESFQAELCAGLFTHCKREEDAAI